MTNIGSELANARQKVGMTQAQMAAKLGLTQSRLSQIEHGRTTRLDTIESYARALGLELLLVPQREVRRLRSILDGAEPASTDEQRPSLFPSLADLQGEESTRGRAGCRADEPLR